MKPLLILRASRRAEARRCPMRSLSFSFSLPLPFSLSNIFCLSLLCLLQYCFLIAKGAAAIAREAGKSKQQATTATSLAARRTGNQNNPTTDCININRAYLTKWRTTTHPKHNGVEQQNFRGIQQQHRANITNSSSSNGERWAGAALTEDEQSNAQRREFAQVA